MIKFTKTDFFLVEEKTINIRFKEYKIKVPTVKDWLIIQSLDLNSENIERATLEKIVELFIIGYPKEKINELIDLELYGIATECFKMFQVEEKKKPKEEMTQLEQYEAELEEQEDEYNTEISFEYLVSKLCKNYSLTIDELLNTKYHHFLILIRGLDIVNAEEILKYCEATHVYLKSEQGVKAYKEMIGKYENIFKKGVKSKPTIYKINEGIQKLKAMLAGGK